MVRGPKRPEASPDVIGNAVRVAQIAAGEAEEDSRLSPRRTKLPPRYTHNRPKLANGPKL
jgi:hypothetical protein